MANAVEKEGFTIVVDNLEESKQAFTQSDYKCTVCVDAPGFPDDVAALKAAAKALGLKLRDVVVDNQTRKALTEDFKEAAITGQFPQTVRYACIEFLLSKARQ